MNKQEKIEQIYENLKSKLNENQIFVPGEGNVNCKLLLIGEAPGAKETQLGRPFVGKAGENLDEFLKVIHFDREDIYISNVVKFRPYKLHATRNTKSNRPPTKDEIALCYQTLKNEIETINPKIIVTLGNTALKTVLHDTKIKISDCHGTKIPYENGSFLFALYHPASIIYNRSLLPVYNNDLELLNNILNES